MASRIYLFQRSESESESDTGAVGAKDGSWRENASAEDLILEAWSQGIVSIPQTDLGSYIEAFPLRT